MNGLIGAALVLAQLAGSGPAEPVPAHTQPRAQTQTGAAQQIPVIPDAWFGADKFQHFWVSYAATSFAFAAASAAGQDTDAALVVAVPVGAAAGVGKELSDRRRGGPFSVKDLVADALGVAAAYFFLREVR